MNSLIYFGDRLKALDDNGKVGGYAVRFSDGRQKDLSGEFFTKGTYLGAHQGDGVDVMFHHGMPLPVKANLTKAQSKRFQEFADHLFTNPVKTSLDDIGLWAETVMDMADAYEAAVFGMVKAEKLGWSSGTASHTARVKSDSGEILRWPIIEISLTPTPCEPLNRAIPMKSLEGVKFANLNDLLDKSSTPPEGASAGSQARNQKRKADDDDDDEDEELDKFIPGQKFRSSFVAKVDQIMEDLLDTGEYKSRKDIYQLMAIETGILPTEVERMLTGSTRPSDAKLKGFARILRVTFDTLKGAVDKAPAQSIKAIFEDALADRDLYSWTLWDVYAKVVRQLVTMYINAKATGVQFDLAGKIDEVNGEYSARLKESIFRQANDHMDGPHHDEPFYLKSISERSADLLADLSIDLDQHCHLVESAEQGVVKRFRGFHETRVKAGRVLSDKNRSRLSAHLEQIVKIKEDIERLLDESVPMSTKEERLAAESKFLRYQSQRIQQGAVENV
jgi:transcriptional regulator with XRE-family HTH domain